MYSVYTPNGYLEVSNPEPRRLIICCDGTWQSSVTDRDNVPSNITRLSRLISKRAYDKDSGKWWQQIVYYDAGVGTGDAGGVLNIEAKRKGASRVLTYVVRFLTMLSLPPRWHR
jgi:uncharacterized protein (DUF2235 family)